MAATTALREALNRGISSGSFADTEIILYSHRDSSGRVCRPKALYANSYVLKTVPYFKDRESTVRYARAEPHSIVSIVLSRNSVEPRSKEFSKEAIGDEESTEDYGYSSDSDLEDDEDDRISPLKYVCQSIIHPFNLFGAPGEDRKIPCKVREEFLRGGGVIEIPDMAFVT